MTLHKNAQVRADLNAADRVVHACWSNFIATEPTYVLRDLIVIEIQNARDAERERCAAIVYNHQIAFASDACGWALDKIKDGLPADAIR